MIIWILAEISVQYGEDGNVLWFCPMARGEWVAGECGRRVVSYGRN
jgi:hypothetical protein